MLWLHSSAATICCRRNLHCLAHSSHFLRPRMSVCWRLACAQCRKMCGGCASRGLILYTCILFVEDYVFQEGEWSTEGAEPWRVSTSNVVTCSRRPRISGRPPRACGSSRIFCPPEVADPAETVEWELRSAAIKDESGEVLFEQQDCEIPEGLESVGDERRGQQVLLRRGRHAAARAERAAAGPSRGAHDRRLGHGGRLFRDASTTASGSIASWRGCVSTSTARSIRRSGSTWVCITSTASRATAATGAGIRTSCQADAARTIRTSIRKPRRASSRAWTTTWRTSCRWPRSEAMLFKFGSGTGTDLSTIRSHREKLSGGGRPSGPLSFMRVYDQIAAVVKSGGKTRRAAKMQSLKVWHPDILEFIECKWKEEKKAHVLIEKGGYEANFNGEAYSSILFQNANLSVRVTDEFMETVQKGGSWTTRWVTDDRRQGPTLRGAGPVAADGRMCLALRRPGRAVRHDDQSLAHLPELRAHQRQQSLLGVHVPGRHGLQPGQHQPDEVPPGGRAVRRRAVSRRPAGSSSSRRKSWWITPAIRRSGSRRTATTSGRWDWVIRTWAA